jgi:hypothetical protein
MSTRSRIAAVVLIGFVGWIPAAQAETTGEIDCRGPTGSTTYPKCADIPVIVLKTQGGCTALLPYQTLVVYTKKKTTTVTWNLFAPAGFTFTNNGIAIPNPPSGYTSVGSGSNGTRFSWSIAGNAPVPTSAAPHTVNVIDPTGNGCVSADPVITHDASR